MTVLNMDCIEGMRLFPDAYFDSIVTDPPYELGFMGKGWDSTGIANNVEMWREALRVLKPGGHMLAFSGSRTYHRMVCAIEDAGFEIRDQILWIYSSGFPKSHNLDNHRGGRTCGCETLPECDVRPMRDADVSPPVNDGAQREQVLRPSVQEQSAHNAVLRLESGESGEGRGECCLAGRRDAAPSEGELRASALREGPGLGATDGAEGRLHHGAPTGHGGMVRDAADASGDSAPRRPRADQQPAQQPRIVAGQSQSQTRGAWPICGRCGKPILPRGLGTALKPSFEPVVVARKPLIGTVAANVLAHRTGALNIDGCRVGYEAEDMTARLSRTGAHAGEAYGNTGNVRYSGGEVAPVNALGRWPANLITSYPEDGYALRSDVSPEQRRAVLKWMYENS